MGTRVLSAPWLAGPDGRGDVRWAAAGRLAVRPPAGARTLVRRTGHVHAGRLRSHGALH